MNNHHPYMDRSMFTKPPPNYNNGVRQYWNNFKVPPSPVGIKIKKNSSPNSSSTSPQSTSATSPDSSRTSQQPASRTGQQTSRIGQQSPSRTGQQTSKSGQKTTSRAGQQSPSRTGQQTTTKTNQQQPSRNGQQTTSRTGQQPPPGQTSGNYLTNTQVTSRNYATQQVPANYPNSQGHSRNYSNLQSHQNSLQSQASLRNYHNSVQSPPQVIARNYQNSQAIAQNYHNHTQTNPQLIVRNYQNQNHTQTSGQAVEAQNYQNAPPTNSVRNFKNEPPPNYPVQRHEAASTSSDECYKDLVFNPVGFLPAQPPYEPNVPPPNIQKTQQNPQCDMNLNPKPATVQAQAQSYEGAKANYYMQMLYRYRQVADYSQLLAYSTVPVHPPPPNYPPPQQPPLPPDAPPQAPPPPPPTLKQTGTNSMVMKNHQQNHQNHQNHQQNHQNRQQNHQNHHHQNHQNHVAGPSHQAGPSSAHGGFGIQNRQIQNQHMGNYQGRMSHKFAAYSPPYKQQMYYGSKRKYEGGELKKMSKKRKKPLSQIVPQKKDWSLEDAKKALEVEKECNKRSKRQGLILKFPDQELNRDIVTSFHTSIESVHFQQPSTPRYCFVTLTDSADHETVIKQLNKIPFGLGYLSAEYKKDREDEQNIRPTDIDPLTLYVGNLAQEITKEDMTRAFPMQKRIDIGYAKKMKYTRYAFVSFHTADEAIEAFKKTHSSQMYSKSLIVRFRRLHGTVGMPGEPRLQTNPRATPEINLTVDPTMGNNPWDIDISHWENEEVRTPDDIRMSEEEEEDEDLMKTNPVYLPPTNFETRMSTNSPNDEFVLHRPEQLRIKQERDDEDIECNGYSENYYQSPSEENHDHDSHQSSPQVPETETTLNHQIQNDDKNHQQTSPIEQPVIKEELIKEEGAEEDIDHVTTRFRVIPQSIKPTSTQCSRTDTPSSNCSSSSPASVLNTTNNLPDGFVTIIKQEIENPSEMSEQETQDQLPEKDSSSNSIVKSNDSLDTITTSVDVSESMIIPPLIIPTPIVIKKESDEDVPEEKQNCIQSDSSNAEIERRPSGNGSPSNSFDLHDSSSNLHGSLSERVNSNDGYVEPVGSQSSSNEPVGISTQSSTNKDSSEKSSDQYGNNEENFSWINMDYANKEVKTELDDPAGDDNSSDDELSIHDILKKARK